MEELREGGQGVQRKAIEETVGRSFSTADK